MKRLVSAALIAASIFSAAALCGCDNRPAEVIYTLSEDGTHYIVSEVQGNKSALREYEILGEYSAEEGGQTLPVTEIGDRAFMSCTNLRKITIPDTVTTIGVNAFVQCSFTELMIPESVETIDYGAFGMCRSLREVTVPYGVKNLGALAFYCCSSLETVYIKSQTDFLEFRSFYNGAYTQGGNVFTNSQLTKVYLSKTIKKIHREALAGNPITDFYFEGTEEEWNAVYFYYTELKEGTEDTYEEKRVDKKDIMGSVTVHYNVQF